MCRRSLILKSLITGDLRVYLGITQANNAEVEICRESDCSGTRSGLGYMRGAWDIGVTYYTWRLKSGGMKAIDMRRLTVISKESVGPR